MSKKLGFALLTLIILSVGVATAQFPTTATAEPGRAVFPIALVIFGAALAVGLAGIGSAIGISRPASMGLGAMQEDRALFLPSMVLAALPGTQGIYGFVVAFMALQSSGIMGASMPTLTLAQGWNFFFACLPIALAGFISAIYQGNVCASGVALAAKDKSQWTRGMILGVFVEFYAILGFLISLLILGKIAI